MNQKILVVLLFAWSGCFAQKTNSPDPIKDRLTPIELKQVKVEGEIGRRIAVTIENNLLLLNIDRDFLDSFEKKNDVGYIGLGKLIDGVVKMASYTNDEKLKSLKKHLIDQVIKAQEPDGYIGNMSRPNRMWNLWDIHEMGYIIYGLITNYQLFGDKKSLDAAVKAADYLLLNWSSMPKGWENTTGVATRIAITGIHRTILALYGATNDHKYQAFCLNQLDLKNLDPGIVVGRRKLIEGHIYGYMAGCLAQLELYRTVPDKKLLIPTMKALNFLTSHDGMSITGGAGQAEIWTDDQDGEADLGESCATAYQLRIYDNLLRLRGESRLGDMMERTIYNALFGAQSPEGRQIRYFTPLEGDRHYHNGDTYCCPCNYRRIIADLPSMVYYKAENGIAINLYSESNATILLDNDRSVALTQQTDYPNTGHVVINVNPSKTTSFALKLRIPSWCSNASVSVNGKPSAVACKSGTFASIDRIWKAGDQVILDMPMTWRLVLGRQRQAGRVATMRGPLVFCLNPSLNDSLQKKDGVNPGRIVIDLESIEPAPVRNSTVRPDGIACRLKADDKLFSMGNTGNINLTLTEFADPDGKCTYFRVPDLSKAVPDELLGSWK